MTYDQAVAYFGNYKTVANKLGLAPTTVHSWRKRGIPEGRQFQLQLVSRGRLRVGNGART